MGHRSGCGDNLVEAIKARDRSRKKCKSRTVVSLEQEQNMVFYTYKTVKGILEDQEESL